jgi:hypothetical protein
MTTKIPVELSSTPGIVDGSNATAITIDSSENVGIGTSSPRGVLDLGSGSGDGTLDNTPANYQLILEAAQSTTGDIARNIAFVNSTNNVSAAINSVDGGTGLTQDLMFAVAASGALSEIMRLDAAGNVGIGTASPSALLHLANAGPSIKLEDTDNNSDYEIKNGNGTFRIIDTTNSTDRLNILSSGNVGIGTTSPIHELHVASSHPVIALQDTDSTEPLSTYIDFLDSGDNSHGYIGYGSSSSDLLQIANRYDDIVMYTGSSGSLSEAMRIDSSGNLYVGGTDAAYSGTKLITGSYSSNLAGLSILNSTTGTGYLLFGDGAGTAGYVGQITYSHLNGAMAFVVDGATAQYIDSSRVVGIGTTTPSDNSTTCLYLKGNEHVMSIRNLSTSSSGERVSIDFLDHNGTRRGYISVDTSGTLYSTSSDYRLKNVIEPVTNGIERINKLNPVKFEWKDTGKEEEGFIAHEVDEIFGDAVGGKKDAVKEDGSIDAQTMDYGRITPLLVKAIQEQQEQIEQLKTEIQTLKGE